MDLSIGSKGSRDSTVISMSIRHSNRALVAGAAITLVRGVYQTNEINNADRFPEKSRIFLFYSESDWIMKLRM